MCKNCNGSCPKCPVCGNCPCHCKCEIVKVKLNELMITSLLETNRTQKFMDAFRMETIFDVITLKKYTEDGEVKYGLRNGRIQVLDDQCFTIVD